MNTKMTACFGIVSTVRSPLTAVGIVALFAACGNDPSPQPASTSGGGGHAAGGTTTQGSGSGVGGSPGVGTGSSGAGGDSTTSGGQGGTSGDGSGGGVLEGGANGGAGGGGGTANHGGAGSSEGGAPDGAAPIVDAQATYYVSPTGSDTNPGTLGAPFQTLAKARDVVRTKSGNMTGDIYTFLRGGTYRVTATIDFGPQDSGTNGHRIFYQAFPGETPVLNGATQVVGWTKHTGNLYKAALSRTTKLRNLYVNDARAAMTSKKVTSRGAPARMR